MTAASPYQTVKHHQIKVLLVDDQPIISESVKMMLADEFDIDFAYCSDPTQALDVANEFEPTVILQDLLMPEMDGMTLVKYFRANHKTKEVPLIVLSAKEEPTVKAEAFTHGANDYLVKLPGKEELLARIRYHSKGYISLLERNEAYQKLAESQQVLQEELDEAAEYVKSLLPEPLDGEKIQTAWKFIPSAQLGGDAFGYHWLDQDNFAIYLFDVCGHGIKAALLSISILNVLRSKSLRNTDYHQPKGVLAALNSAFPMEQNHQMFFTMWYGVFNRQNQTLTYSSGGHPPALLIDTSKELKELHTDGLLVGGFEEASFEQKTAFIETPAKLLIYSDGVFEIEKEDHSHMTFPEFKQFVQEQAKNSCDLIEKILQHSKQSGRSGPFSDDYSLLQISMP